MKGTDKNRRQDYVKYGATLRRRDKVTADGVLDSSHECRRFTNLATSAERRRTSSSVIGDSLQPVHGDNRKRLSGTSYHSATSTDNVEHVPGINIQHIEALPYHVAVVTTDCGAGGRVCDEDVVVSAMSAGESDNKHRYIIIHNELSSVSSLSHSRSSKASSLNMNDCSSVESDTDPTAVTMTTRSTTAVAANRRRHSTQQVI